MLLIFRYALVSALIATPMFGATASASPSDLGKIDHIVVIYEENHSFDNLYGTWGKVGAEHVVGVDDASKSSTHQVAQNGTALKCLYQKDVNLTSPSPLPATCIDTAHPATQGSPPVAQPVNSAFPNQPWLIDKYIPADATTCSDKSGFSDVLDGTGTPGGCTADLVHRFYQEQYQINDGRQNRYVTGSDAAGLTMGYYDSTKLPIYKYLHGNSAPKYVIADNFFQGAFGGSFLNHQVLVSAQAPIFANADRSGRTTGCATGTSSCDLHSVVDSNGFPNSYPYYTPSPGITVKDQPLTESADPSGHCAPSFTGATTPPANTKCGDYAVNTIQPFTQPFAPGTTAGKRLPLLQGPNIGDSMSAHGVSWAWYAGGWDNAVGNNGHDATHPLGTGWNAGPTGVKSGTCAAGTAQDATFPNCPAPLFQFHHQPFGYFANYADGTVERAKHLADEQKFIHDAARADGLPAVSFVKPIGAENEHPGYASEPEGNSHLVDLIKAVESGPNANNTMVVVTYDEFGGQWDHVSIPGTPANSGPHDAFGPGTRVPTMLISPQLQASGVDHVQHDTTSILATIEHRFDLQPLTDTTGRTTRESQVRDLSSAFSNRCHKTSTFR